MFTRLKSPGVLVNISDSTQNVRILSWDWQVKEMFGELANGVIMAVKNKLALRQLIYIDEHNIWHSLYSVQWVSIVNILSWFVNNLIEGRGALSNL